ncbi:hypothetical protein PRUB_b6006 [Pseudoalteromonas rubra]|uniref:Uncharacterized protein n=1 Tax=Pseudoalteromonas rubra TaxID=43658 RepID=A0A8T0C0U0_9GAMM|nr:hypothetical protein PRUB_b6006 [Pseudoalteromonas rubra]
MYQQKNCKSLTCDKLLVCGLAIAGFVRLTMHI